MPRGCAYSSIGEARSVTGGSCCLVSSSSCERRLPKDPHVGLGWRRQSRRQPKLKAGTSSNVQVKLDRLVNAGEKLMPMLHIDAGTIGTYEFPNGPHIPGTTGDPIV